MLDKMIDDPRIQEAERTGTYPYGTWAGIGGTFEGIKKPLSDGSPDKGKK